MSSTVSQFSTSPKRRICVASSTRADYGHLYWLMKELQNDQEVEFSTLVTGTHLMKDFGETIGDFYSDQIPVTESFDFELRGDSELDVIRTMGVAVARSAECLSRMKTDLLVLLGDRYEILAVAIAAHLLRIPVAHLHGGESTEGATDEAFRHCITKIASLHFVSEQAYLRRVIQLGEDPQRIFCFGAPALDHILKTDIFDRPRLEDFLETKIGRVNLSDYVVAVFHPETLRPESHTMASEFITALLQNTDLKVLASKSNADSDGSKINKSLDHLRELYPHRVFVFSSLGTQGFYSLLKHSMFVFGNSSAGVIDAPALGVRSINIGERQQGRIKPKSVCDVSTKAEFVEILLRAVSASSQSRCEVKTKPDLITESELVSVKIKNVLKNFPLQGILKKKFYDLEFK